MRGRLSGVRSRRVSYHRIVGAILVYLSVAVTF